MQCTFLCVLLLISLVDYECVGICVLMVHYMVKGYIYCHEVLVGMVGWGMNPWVIGTGESGIPNAKNAYLDKYLYSSPLFCSKSGI
jgi:hypothetical protein